MRGARRRRPRRSCPDCEGAATSLVLTTGDAYPLGPDEDYLDALDSTIGQAQQPSAPAGRAAPAPRAHRAAARRGPRRGCGQLQRRGHARCAGLEVSPEFAPANENLVKALRATATGYSTMAARSARQQPLPVQPRPARREPRARAAVNARPQGPGGSRAGERHARRALQAARHWSSTSSWPSPPRWSRSPSSRRARTARPRRRSRAATTPRRDNPCLGAQFDVKQSGKFVSLENADDTLSGALELDGNRLTGDVSCVTAASGAHARGAGTRRAHRRHPGRAAGSPRRWSATHLRPARSGPLKPSAIDGEYRLAPESACLGGRIEIEGEGEALELLAKDRTAGELQLLRRRRDR